MQHFRFSAHLNLTSASHKNQFEKKKKCRAKTEEIAQNTLQFFLLKLPIFCPKGIKPDMFLSPFEVQLFYFQNLHILML